MFLFYVAVFLFLIFCFQSNLNFKLHPYIKNSSDSSHIRKKLLKDQDNYIGSFSKYDFQSKLKTLNIVLHTKNNYIQNCIENCLEWTQEEKNLLSNFYKLFLKNLKKYDLYDNWIRTMPFIYIVKNTMEHEGGATGYTFRNMIFVKKIDYDLLSHELFHIYSRYNPHKKSQLYKLLGFKIANQLKFPDNSIKDLIISNPDTQSIVYTTVKVNNTKFIVTPVIHSDNLKKNNTVKDSFFQDMKTSLLFVNLRKRDDEIVLTPKSMEEYDLPSFISINKVPEYKTQLQQNTKYDIHPEEVLADNFSFIMNNTWKTLSNTDLPKKIIEIMKE